MNLDWWNEGDLCRIKIGTCCVKTAEKYYKDLVKRCSNGATGSSELEFWNGYYNLK